MRQTFDFASRLRDRQLRLQPALRLPRHAAVAGVREARPRERRHRLVQVLQVLVDRSRRAARRGDPPHPLRGAAPAASSTSSRRYPWQTLRLLRRFVRYMPLRDVIYLLVKPFLGARRGATKAEVVSRAVEHADLKSAAADLTQLADDGPRARHPRVPRRARADPGPRRGSLALGGGHWSRRGAPGLGGPDSAGKTRVDAPANPSRDEFTARHPPIRTDEAFAKRTTCSGTTTLHKTRANLVFTLRGPNLSRDKFGQVDVHLLHRQAQTGNSPRAGLRSVFVTRVVASRLCCFVALLLAPAPALWSQGKPVSAANAPLAEGRRLLAAGDRAAAQARFEEALRADPASAEAHDALGFVLRPPGPHRRGRRRVPEGERAANRPCSTPATTWAPRCGGRATPRARCPSSRRRCGSGRGTPRRATTSA